MAISDKMMPTIKIVGARHEASNLTSSTATVELSAHNPNRVKISVKKIEFEVLLSETDEKKPIGTGLKEDVTLAPGTDTPIETQLKLDHANTLGSGKSLLAGVGGMLRGTPMKTEVIVRGTATVDLKLASPKIPFEKRFPLVELVRGSKGHG